MRILIALCGGAVLLAACNPPAGDASPATTPEAPAAELAQDTWVGKWIGPEGLFLDLKKGAAPGAYRMTLKDNLDTQADYDAVAEGSGLKFTRSGQDILIRAGVGADTGFKHLADKRDCLIVVDAAEGYCRD